MGGRIVSNFVIQTAHPDHPAACDHAYPVTRYRDEVLFVSFLKKIFLKQIFLLSNESKNCYCVGMIKKIYCLITVVTLLTACSKTVCSNLDEERYVAASNDVQTAYDSIELPDRPLTLNDIIELAWQNNLDAKVKELDYLVQREVATREAFKMLPQYTFNGEYSHRNPNSAASSILLVGGGSTPFPPQLGQQNTVRRFDVTLTWNFLDFGVAYYRSLQEQNREISLCMQYQRIKQNLIVEVFKSYWKAITAKKASEDARAVLELAASLKIAFEKQIEDRMISQVQGLRVEDQIVSIQLKLYNFDLLYDTARSELAALMGLPADVCFELAPANFIEMPELEDICQLEEAALLNRPELFAADMDVKISAGDVHAALLQILPSPEGLFGYNRNIDRFLLHHNWTIVGLRAAWNLLSIPQHIYDVRTTEMGLEKTKEARLALSVGILAQVHLAYLKYLDASRSYKLHQSLSDVRDRLLTATQGTYDAGEFNIADLLTAQSEALTGEIDALQSYGDLRLALEQVNNTIGIPLYYNSDMPPVLEIPAEVPLFCNSDSLNGD